MSNQDSKQEINNNLLKEIKSMMKVTRKKISELENGKTLEDPIDIDIVKSLKANFFEDALSAMKKAKRKIEEMEDKADD